MIVTPRLRGLPLAETDFDDLHALHRDDRVLAAFGAGPASAAETRAFLVRKLEHWREHGFGIWMFRDPAGEFVGRCGIHRWALAGRAEVELGYIARSEAWSQGYATEMGTGVVRHAFSELGLRALVGFTRADNVPSRRVLEKLAFAYERGSWQTARNRCCTAAATRPRRRRLRRRPQERGLARAPSEPTARSHPGRGSRS
ncbi:MAG: GNAT family N-acetyltransferase [Gaiellaceae bacterium]